MPSLWRVRLPEAGAAILIAAASGRALAAAARRAGYRPLVADFFDDMDTRLYCASNRFVADGLQFGFTLDNLIPALEALAEGKDLCGFVYGAGFEDRPELLEALAERWPLLGNTAEVVRRVKDPLGLAGLCAALGIGHPEISMRAPNDCSNWLAKSAGGSGGSHVAPAAAPLERGKIYFQRFVAGEPVSILFLADGANAQVVGLSRQWTAPAPGEPFRFGGSIRPAGLSPSLENRLRSQAQAVTAACGLRGLNSIDFLVAGGEATLIEINPRPGATLDIFEDFSGSLFQAHLSSCLGCLPEGPLEFGGAAASAVAYTQHEISSMPALDWPYWAADRQKPKSELCAHEPLCTIKARALEPLRARALVNARSSLILDELERTQNANINFGKGPHLEH